MNLQHAIEFSEIFMCFAGVLTGVTLSLAMFERFAKPNKLAIVSPLAGLVVLAIYVGIDNPDWSIGLSAFIASFAVHAVTRTTSKDVDETVEAEVSSKESVDA